MRRPSASRPAEVAAQWRGHVDHDLLARKAVAVARFYGNALLVVESNSLESENAGDSIPPFVLEAPCARLWRNIYRRRCHDSLSGPSGWRIGFHTNRFDLGGLACRRSYRGCAEREAISSATAGTCDELDTYEQLPSGAFAAKEGYHDDILMTRAMALYIIAVSEPAAVVSGEVRGCLPLRSDPLRQQA